MYADVQVHNVGLHPNVLREEGKLVDGETIENIAKLVGRFLEQREPGLVVKDHQVSHHCNRSLLNKSVIRWTVVELTSETSPQLLGL